MFQFFALHENKKEAVMEVNVMFVVPGSQILCSASDVSIAMTSFVVADSQHTGKQAVLLQLQEILDL